VTVKEQKTTDKYAHQENEALLLLPSSTQPPLTYKAGHEHNHQRGYLQAVCTGNLDKFSGWVTSEDGLLC
jgi:hypothetical protein